MSTPTDSTPCLDTPPADKTQRVEYTARVSDVVAQTGLNIATVQTMCRLGELPCILGTARGERGVWLIRADWLAVLEARTKAKQTHARETEHRRRLDRARSTSNAAKKIAQR